MKHPADSGSYQKLKLKYNLKCFVLVLGVWLQRYSRNTKRYPLKKCLETLSLFSLLEFQEKERFYQSWIGHVMLLEG